jgi:hypothetical protein
MTNIRQTWNYLASTNTLAYLGTSVAERKGEMENLKILGSFPSPDQKRSSLFWLTFSDVEKVFKHWHQGFLNDPHHLPHRVQACGLPYSGLIPDAGNFIINIKQSVYRAHQIMSLLKTYLDLLGVVELHLAH